MSTKTSTVTLESAVFPSPVETPVAFTEHVMAERHQTKMELVSVEGCPCVLIQGWYYPLANLHRFKVAEPAPTKKA